MSSTVIEIENLSKLYRLGEVGTGTLQHDLNRWWHRVRGKPDPYQKIAAVNDRTGASTNGWVWALKDVSFKVGQGDILGVVGRNGAGKSTLLKLLSRVTSPSQGSIRVKGRISSLLEVGTGFHPELSGRENIYLNGAILGMRKWEITSKLDEIVSFSGCSAYLDTPVKRYSSGMYVRLAFAVAAHLEPEILVVDEVLAVGDAEFQDRCVGKLQNVSKSGKTILFVSHNLAAIRQLCTSSLVLSQGRIAFSGGVQEGIEHYLGRGTYSAGERVWNYDNQPDRVPTGKFRMLSMKILSSQRYTSNRLDMSEPFDIEVEYELLENLPRLRIGLQLTSAEGILVFTTANSADKEFQNKQHAAGRYRTTCTVPANLLNEGGYQIRLSADVPMVEVLFIEENAISISLQQSGNEYARFNEKWPGVVCPKFIWNNMRIEG